MGNPQTSNHQTSTPERLLTSIDVAELLGGIPYRTLDQWRYRGLGPSYINLGRHIRYTPAAIEAWLSERERTPGVS